MLRVVFCRAVFQYIESNIAYRNSDLTARISAEEL